MTKKPVDIADEDTSANDLIDELTKDATMNALLDRYPTYTTEELRQIIAIEREQRAQFIAKDSE